MHFKITKIEDDINGYTAKIVTVVFDNTIVFHYYTMLEDGTVVVVKPKHTEIIDKVLDQRIRNEIKRVYMMGQHFRNKE